MKRFNLNSRWYITPAQNRLMEPAEKILVTTPPLRSKSNKPLAMTIDDILNILVYYHLNDSGRSWLISSAWGVGTVERFSRRTSPA